MVSASLLVVFPLLMAFAVFSDILTMTIPNRVPAILAVAFVVLAVSTGLPLPALSLHLLIGLVVLGITFGCFAAGWMGGGDAKLMAATALWFGPTEALAQYLLISSVFGGILTLGLLMARAQLMPATGIGFVDHLLQKETGIPYGVALGAGGLVTFSSSGWIEIALKAAG